MSSQLNIQQPIDMIKMSINQTVILKCKNDILIKGILQAFDQHFNILMSEVEETKTIEGQQVIRKIKMLYVRGDTVIHIAPQLKKKKKKE